MRHFKSFSRVKSTQDEKVRFIKGDESKLTQTELLSFFFLRVYGLLFCMFFLCVFKLYLNREVKRK